MIRISPYNLSFQREGKGTREEADGVCERGGFELAYMAGELLSCSFSAG